jgi:hypothetical protein
VVLVVPADVAGGRLLLVATDVGVVDGGVDGGAEALELPPPQPEAATRASTTRTDHHTTERRPGDVTDRFC